MKPSQFTQNHEVYHSIKDLKNFFKERNKELIVSDIIDKAGNQYVDLVQEGGGILGIALAGYIYTLEEMGIRFLNLAGTSAGSITTLLLAATGTPNEKKSDKLIDILANKNFYDFVDGDKHAKKFIKAVVQKARKFKMIIRGLHILDNMKNDMGLNPGDHFENWLKGTLIKYGIENTKDLTARLQHVPEGIRLRQNEALLTRADLNTSFKIIASDLTTNTKVVFPTMGELYYKNILDVNPAEFVRASMSIPIFFAPFKIKNLPNGIHQKDKWVEMAGYKGKIPEEVLIVDGGIMSNFPIDAFHRHNSVPRKPTFGVKLGLDRTEVNEIENYFHLIYSSFESARQIRDFEFIFNNQDFTKLVANIDSDGFNWLNFNIPDNDKIKLFAEGVKAACKFLREFDWKIYKNMRFKKIVMKAEKLASV